MPSTEDRIKAREKVRAGNRDYTNPFVHLREIVVDEVKALAKTALVMTIMGSEKDRAEAKARMDGIKLVMDRFPEIDWGDQPVAQPPATQTRTTPTGVFAQAFPPIGFKEDCGCGACSAYRHARDFAN